MPEIAFTQVTEDGSKTAITIDMPQKICDDAQEFIAAGGVYTSMLLPGNDVVLSAECEVEPGRRQAIVCIVCFNDASVPDSVETLVDESIQYLRKARAA